MAANKIIRIPGITLTTTTTTNILNPAITSLAGPVGVTLTQPYLILREIRVGNKTASNATVAFWIGLTGANTAGTEAIFIGAASAGAITQGVSVPANSFVDYPYPVRLDAADFLVGGVSAATALIFTAVAEVGLV